MSTWHINDITFHNVIDNGKLTIENTNYLAGAKLGSALAVLRLSLLEFVLYCNPICMDLSHFLKLG